MATIGFGWYAGMNDLVKYANGAWHVIADPGDYNPLPGRNTAGRIMPEGGEPWEHQCVADGTVGAERYFGYCLPRWRRAPWVACWLGPNEPASDNAAQADALSVFYVRLAQLAHGAGVEIAGGSFSRGRPDENILEHYIPMAQACDYIAVHEYGKPAGMDNPADLGWHCLRYRRLADVLRRAGCLKPFIVTELGIDDDAKGGWSKYVSGSEFVRQLRWYATQTQADSYVVGAVLFAGSAYGWGSFLANDEVGAGVSQINAQLGPVQPAPVPTPTPTPVPVPVPTPTSMEIAPRLRWPLSVTGTITQEFGSTAVNYSAYGLIGHNGRDIAAPSGTPIVATHPGQCWVYDDPGYGRTVEVWYPTIAAGKYKTIYAHMSAQVAVHGQMVEPGMIIGKVGSTGNSTGPHLHTGLKLLRGKNPGYRDWVDPKPYMEK